MSVYRALANVVGTPEARDLAGRLAAWHDAMVLHQRRAGSTGAEGCDGDCPHAEAETLWTEALDVYGERAHELGFLQGHAARPIEEKSRD